MWEVLSAGTSECHMRGWSSQAWLFTLILKFHRKQIQEGLTRPVKVVNHWTRAPWQHIFVASDQNWCYKLLLYKRHSVYHTILTRAIWNTSKAQSRQVGGVLFKLSASASLIPMFFFPTKKLQPTANVICSYVKALHLAFTTQSIQTQARLKLNREITWFYTQSCFFVLQVPCATYKTFISNYLLRCDINGKPKL